MEDKIAQIIQIAQVVRDQIVAKYGTGLDLEGYCLEASVILAEKLQAAGFDKAVYKSGCVKYDNAKDITDPSIVTPSHTWVEIPVDDTFIYVDVTADQFNNDWMSPEHHFEPITICEGYPYGVEPDKE